MDTRKTILIYQYAERIKSELIIASDLLAKMLTLGSEERTGAEKMMHSYLEALTREIKIAQNIEKSVNFVGAEKKVVEATGRLRLSEYSEMNRCISEALSLITTSCQAAMEALEQEQLI
jgi:negative regulator of replication initiation